MASPFGTPQGAWVKFVPDKFLADREAMNPMDGGNKKAPEGAFSKSVAKRFQCHRFLTIFLAECACIFLHDALQLLLVH